MKPCRPTFSAETVYDTISENQASSSDYRKSCVFSLLSVKVEIFGVFKFRNFEKSAFFQYLDIFGICSSLLTHCVRSNRFFEVFIF